MQDYEKNVLPKLRVFKSKSREGVVERVCIILFAFVHRIYDYVFMYCNKISLIHNPGPRSNVCHW